MRAGRAARRISTIGLSIVFTAGLLTATASAASDTAWKSELNDLVPPAMKQAKMPGLIIGVWKGDERVYLKAFGVTNTKTGAPLKTDSHVRIGSLTKAYTIMGILQLAAEGKVSLDDPIGKYVQGVPNGSVITLRELAQMRSGLGDHSAVIVPELYKDPKQQYTLQQLLDIGLAQPVRAQPNTEFDYNNTNTVLLGAVLEQVSGMSRADYVQQRIAEPLGLKGTLVPSGYALPNPHGRGYGDWNPQEKVVDSTDWNPSWGNAAGDMVSTVDDIGVFARALGQGKLITPAMKQERDQGLPADTEGKGVEYGLAYELHPAGWEGHNGRIAGWTTWPYYLPEEDVTIVVSMNTSANPLASWALYQDIVKTITPDHPFSDPPTE